MTFVRVPCNLLGMILDHGRASAYAAHLLAIKASKGSSFVLNERHVAHEYGLSRRAFQIGMRLLKKTKVLERSQSSRRAYATEVLAASSYNYVLIDEGLLKAKSTLVAYILAVNLSPDPLHPAKVAKRLGIKTSGTWRKLVHAAVERGDVARTVTGRGATLLARRGFNFDLVKNEPAKNVPAKIDAAL
jgi:hypothetical protein